MIATESNTHKTAEPTADDSANREHSAWADPKIAFESGMEALCELGSVLCALRWHEERMNDVLSTDRAAVHRAAVEQAILDLAIGLGCQRSSVQLSYGPDTAE